MKFIATRLAPSIRDKYGWGYKISAIDESKETLGFKDFLGIKVDSEVDTDQKNDNSDEDDDNLGYITI